MSESSNDPSEPIREKAASYPDVEEGMSCNQSAFKSGKSAFLYIGMQGGRHKAMFKLSESMPEATRLAEQEPDTYQVGSTAWVTTRFTPESPIPKKIWQKWLDESYRLSRTSAKNPVGKKVVKNKAKTNAKKVTAKKRSRKK